MNKLPKIKNHKNYAWLVAYIDSEMISRVKKDLKRSIEYERVQAFIPTVKILRKVHKGKQKFEEIPLLFNYGFFRIPREYANSTEYLENMRLNIPCIISWLKDTCKTPNRLKKKKKKAVDEDEPETPKHISKHARQKIRDLKIPVATATMAEIEELITDSFSYSAHSPKDLQQLSPGTLITLRGYPWEGVQAEFIKVDTIKKKVHVKMQLFNSPAHEIEVAYDNVFFTIYHNKNYDDSLSTMASLDDMADKKSLDKLTFMKGGQVDRV